MGSVIKDPQAVAFPVAIVVSILTLVVMGVIKVCFIFDS
jgi:hypothetical protein